MRGIDFLSSPFLKEESLLFDHEVSTDYLCSNIALVSERARRKYPKLHKELDPLVEQVYHLNGSIRGKLSIDEKDLIALHERYKNIKGKVEHRAKGMLLPKGCEIACRIHILRCEVIKVVRTMHKIKHSGVEVPNILFDYGNLLANYFFVLSLYANELEGREEEEFISKSY